MTEEEIITLVAKVAGVDASEITVKKRQGRQIKANALWEGSSSPSSGRVPVGVFFATNAPELAMEGAARRMALSVPYPEAVVALFDAEGAQKAAVFGYSDSAVAANLANALSVPLETVPRPANAVEARPATSLNAGALRSALTASPNVVLQGPPGTGKSSLAIELVRELVEEAGELTVEQCRFGSLLEQHHGDIGTLVSDTSGPAHKAGVVWEMVQLHPGYGYDDLVRRVRPASVDGDLQFIVEDRLLPRMCALATARGADKPVVLILDEINRCNLGATLGEFIFAIDPAHRSTPVRLQYQGTGLSPSVAVPPNLWIVGTMNTADRSIAMVDYAIRRRFRFLDVPAELAAIESWYLAHEAFRNAATELFTLANQALSSRVMVGHAFFLIDPFPVATWPGRFARQFAFQVAPLLSEYVREGLRPAGPLVWKETSLDIENPVAVASTLEAAIKSHLEP